MMMLVVPTGAKGAEKTSSALLIKSGVDVTIMSGGVRRSVLPRWMRGH